MVLDPYVKVRWSSMTRVVTFKVSEEFLERLDRFARMKNMSRSEVIRNAIEIYLMLEDHKHYPQPRIVKLQS